ncbi:hypothetical protein U6B65_08480 [Oscillospiraceae bacterium MB08-C2-2]|nr:hypothetical protein U6B65_08480 [Oscillospiraceae bacterium MB08-C2-2]
MEEKKLLASQDCRQTGYDISLEGKVVVLSAAVLPEAHRSAEHQLYFCTGGFGSKQCQRRFKFAIKRRINFVGFRREECRV